MSEAKCIIIYLQEKSLPNLEGIFLFYLPLPPLGAAGRGAGLPDEPCDGRDPVLGRGDELGALDAGLGVGFCGAL
jgi:hypothetical protein